MPQQQPRHGGHIAVGGQKTGDSPVEFYPGDRVAVSVLVIAALFVLTQLYAAIPLLGPVEIAMGADATFALSTCFSVTYAVGFLVWGPISDRYGRKKVMTASIGVLAMATLLCSGAPSLLMLAGLRALQGVAASGFAPVALAYLTEAVAPQRRARAIGAMSAAFLVAGIFGQVLASTIALRTSWSWFFVACGVALAIIFVIILLSVAEAPDRTPSMTLMQQFGNLIVLLFRPAIVLLSVAHITLLLSFVTLYSGIGRHLEGFHIAASNIILVRLAALPAMFISLGAGALAKRIGAIRVAQVGFGLAAIGMLGETFTAQTIFGIVASSIVYVSGVALSIPSMIILYGETAAPHRGSGMAINGFVLFIGASIGALVGKVIGGFGALTLTLVALLVIAAISLLTLEVIQRKDLSS
ncbi:hypothetical protein HMPREF1531_00068 [Propionibacterium sp. oral taxon 192 str. F0372]|nr:hypothetical protein HMPREF1531_00068 [Propionibacterium sp. oral taxon 192 str. F0372]